MRRFRGAIALDENAFVPFCLAWQDEALHDLCRRFVAMQLTHVIVMLSGEYRGKFPWFWLWDSPLEIRRKLAIIRSYGLLTVLWAANGESFRARQLGIDARDIGLGDITETDPLIPLVRDGEEIGLIRRGVPLNLRLTTADGFFGPRTRGVGKLAFGDSLEAVWRRTLPDIADLIDVAVPAPEMNDIWSPADQHRYTVLLAELLPNAYRLVHFTRGRCHGDHNRGTGPDGQPPAAWDPKPDPNNPGLLMSNVVGYWRNTPAHGLYYNVPYDHFEDHRAFVDDLGDVSVRVNGRMPVPGKHAPYPGMERDVIFGEAAAEYVLQRRWSYAQGARLRELALSVPGITGYGD